MVQQQEKWNENYQKQEENSCHWMILAFKPREQQSQLHTFYSCVSCFVVGSRIRFGDIAYKHCVSMALLNRETALYCVRRTSADQTCWRNAVIWPRNTLCLLPPPTARLCQHHRDGHPQVSEREEPTQGEKGEDRRCIAAVIHYCLASQT